MNRNNNFYCKYIHLMYGHDTKFNKLLIDFILDSDNGFDKRQHLFVTPYKNVYDNLKHYDNVVLDESGKNLYKIYYKHCNLIISHSSETLTRLIFTPGSQAKDIIPSIFNSCAAFKVDSLSIILTLQYSSEYLCAILSGK